MNFESIQTRPRVAYAPFSSATEELAALAPPAALLVFLDDGATYRPKVPRSPRCRANEQLTALAPPAPLGVPWDSSQSIGRASYAPRSETVDVLLALGSVDPGAFGPWLDSPPAISRYTVITPEQEDAAELGALSASQPSVHGWGNSRSMSSWRASRAASSSDVVAELSGLPLALAYFELAEPARRQPSRARISGSEAAALPGLPPPLPYFDMAEPARRAPLPPPQLRFIAAQDQDSALPSIGFLGTFELADRRGTIFFSTPTDTLRLPMTAKYIPRFGCHDPDDSASRNVDIGGLLLHLGGTFDHVDVFLDASNTDALLAISVVAYDPVTRRVSWRQTGGSRANKALDGDGVTMRTGYRITVRIFLMDGRHYDQSGWQEIADN
jgi:hypothetical protein